MTTDGDPMPNRAPRSPSTRLATLALASILALTAGCDFREPKAGASGDSAKPSGPLKETTTPSAELLTLPGEVVFEETFDGPKLDPSVWNDTTKAPGAQGSWEIVNGQLHSKGTRNAALWLSKPLPDRVRVEFDARSGSPQGDIKAEIFGDGKTHESGYVLIFGGWKNTTNAIARLDEHGKDRCDNAPSKVCRLAASKNTRVAKGKTYKLAVVRVDHVVRWFVDGKLFMAFADPAPLTGPKHAHFGFNDWAVPLYFDNLKVTDLTNAPVRF